MSGAFSNFIDDGSIRRDGRAKVIQLSENRVDLVSRSTRDRRTACAASILSGTSVRRQHANAASSIPRKAAGTGSCRTSDTYDPDRVTYDRELLRKFYLSEGYADFRVVSAVAELTRIATVLFLTFTIR